MDEKQIDQKMLAAFAAAFDAIKLLPEERQKRVLKALAVMCGIE